MNGYPWSYIVRWMNATDRQALAQRWAPQGQGDAAHLAEALANPERIARSVKEADARALRLLSLIWLAGGQASWESVQRLHPEVLSALVPCAQAGLLVQLRVDYYHQVLAIPDEVQNVVARLVMEPRMRAFGEGKTDLSRVSAWPWASDLFRFISHLRWQGGPLTQQGELYKRTKTQIMQGLWPQQALPPDERLTVLLTFADWARLIRIDRLQRQIDVTTEAPDFFRRPPAERETLWQQHWEDVQVPSVTLGPVLWQCFLLLPPGTGVSMEHLISLLAESDLISLPRIRSSVASFITLAERHGWLHADGDLWYLSARSTREQSGPSEAVVQPTGEVIVPVETPLAVLWEAETVLSLKKADVIWTYRFDTDALERALMAGLTPEQAISRLKNLSRVELPENIVAEIHDGWRKASRARVLEATVVWGHTREMTDVLAETLGPLVLERLSDQVLVVSLADGLPAVERLRRQGYLVRSRVESPGRPMSRSLVEPFDNEYRYRPQIQASLPGGGTMLPGGASGPNDITVMIQEAMSRGGSLHLEVVPVGQSHSIPLVITPVNLQGGYVTGISVSEGHQPVVLHLQQISRAWRVS